MSKKNIWTVLKGKDSSESNESEEEKNETPVINANIKTSKAEIAVADSTTGMITPNLSSIFHTVDTDDPVACNSIASTPEVHSVAVENVSSAKMHQENETVVQSNFLMEDKISVLSDQHGEILTSEDALSPSGQMAGIVTTENNDDDELEDGEVLSEEEKSPNSGRHAIINKQDGVMSLIPRHFQGRPIVPERLIANDQNCSQHLTIHRNLFTVNAQDGSSTASMPKTSRNSESSTDATNKVVEERRLHMLELELRARAIEALIKRSDNKP
uniref:Uncharacterized protein n=1 Tax=Elaeophora elaphi TaxID=1147741 RepID=A0A0R3S201_9BILA